jgi:hypothetical protein
MKVCEKRVLRRIYGLKLDKIVEGEKTCIIRNFITCAVRHVYFVWQSQGGYSGLGMKYILIWGKMHTSFT